MKKSIFENITNATLTNIPEAITSACKAYNADKSKANEAELNKAVKAENNSIIESIYSNAIEMLTAENPDYNAVMREFALSPVTVYKVSYAADTLEASISIDSKALNFAKCDAYYRNKYAKEKAAAGTSKAEAKKLAAQKTLCKNIEALRMLELFAVNLTNARMKEIDKKVKYTYIYNERHPERYDLFKGRNCTSNAAFEKQLNAIKSAIGFKDFNFNRSDVRACLDLFVKADIGKVNDINYIIGKIATLLNIIFVCAKTRINNKAFNVKSKDANILTVDEKKKAEAEAKKAEKAKTEKAQANKTQSNK